MPKIHTCPKPTQMKGLGHVGLSRQQAVAQEWEEAALWAEVWKHAWTRNGLGITIRSVGAAQPLKGEHNLPSLIAL